MVLKPNDFPSGARKGFSSLRSNAGGREYLLVIYGSEYHAPENLEFLRSRSLGKKRSLALREFALGHDALRRFTGREPLRREAVFAILALQSEPLVPRL